MGVKPNPHKESKSDFDAIYTRHCQVYHNHPHSEAEELARVYICGGDFHFNPSQLDAENVNKVCRLLGLEDMYPDYDYRVDGKRPCMLEWHLSYINRELIPRVYRRQLLAPIGVVLGAENV